MTDAIYVPPPPPPQPPPPPVPPAGTASFDFAKPFTFIFDDPRWINKVLIGGLFYLLAFMIVGVFFILGYMARLARNVIAGMPHPLPEWDDLGEYFSEGLRLFAVAIVWMLPIFAVVGMFLIPTIIASEINNEAFEHIGGCAIGAMWCLIFPLGLAVTFFLPAAMLMAVVERRFGAAFEIGRIWQFVKANIGDYLLAIVIYFVARFVGGLGFILLCIGVIFTEFWALLITTHAFAHVYRRSQMR